MTWRLTIKDTRKHLYTVSLLFFFFFVAVRLLMLMLVTIKFCSFNLINKGQSLHCILQSCILFSYRHCRSIVSYRVE